MRRIAFLLCAEFFLVACGSKEDSLPYYNTPAFDPLFVADDEVTEKIPHVIDDFSLTDQHGSAITQKDVEGKVHVANFIFTSCGSICPKMTNNMKKISHAFDDNVNVVLLSYSVTPWIDSVARLREYAEVNDIANPNWHLLTGNKSKIYNLARTSYFAEEDLGFTKDSTEFLHTEHFILVDKNRRIRGIYNGTLQLEITQLIKDIESLL
ncbi:MAG TPA: SCO family protein [Chryseosolibacter sp.]|nr:SCO family protein [Chryseosolibacter sp.]